MKSKLRTVILIIATVVFGFSTESYGETEFNIKELVKLENGKAVKCPDEEADDLVVDEGKEAIEIKPGAGIPPYYSLECKPGVNVALQTNDNEVVWLNYETRVGIKPERRVEVKGGEIYADGISITTFEFDYEFEDSGGPKKVIIEPKERTDLYLKVDSKSKHVYVFSGEAIIKIGSKSLPVMILKENLPCIDIPADLKSEGFEKLSPKKYSESKEVMRWIGNVKSYSTPFWRKPKFYIPTAAIAIGAAVFYLTREAGVTIYIGYE